MCSASGHLEDPPSGGKNNVISVLKSTGTVHPNPGTVHFFTQLLSAKFYYFLDIEFNIGFGTMSASIYVKTNLTSFYISQRVIQ